MKDLTKGNELKTIIYFSLPILIGNLFQQIYNIPNTIIAVILNSILDIFFVAILN